MIWILSFLLIPCIPYIREHFDSEINKIETHDFTLAHNSVIIFPYFSRGLIEAKRTEGMNYIKPAAMIPVDTTVNESSFGS